MKSSRGYQTNKTSTESKTRTNLVVGKAGVRELRNLLRSTRGDPTQTIQDFQRTHSLHSMFATAFQTIPKYEANKDDSDESIESLDTDSVLMFLHHLGVSQHEVHKRVSDALRTSIEDEIRKMKETEPLLMLLKSCWPYSTTIPELRPVLWAVLRQLGTDTPENALQRLGERDENGALKHAEVWHPLPPLIKRLVWEADWENTLKVEIPDDPKEYLKLLKGTLFAEQLQPWIDQYVTKSALTEAANKAFVSSQRERRFMTTQRRALSSNMTNTLISGKKDAKQQQLDMEFEQTSKAVAEMRQLLSGGDSPAYRPKLLYSALSLLIAYHSNSSSSFMGGANDLYCTLLSDILLSSPLPKAYLPVLSLARILDETVKAGVITDQDIISIQAALRQIYPSEINDVSSNRDLKPTGSQSMTQISHYGEVKFLLKRVIASGIAAMKLADPQSLFHEPVTDAIAPGYSKVIQKPMCVKQMENTDYITIQDWDRDVQLMFRNCITYNSGNAGQWFRGEARRQNKVFKEDIYPQAKKLFEEEYAKIQTLVDHDKKQKESGVGEILPLEPTSSRKRTKTEKEDVYLPSMEVLASMLLSDPFVLRLLIDRVLRILRIDVIKGGTIPIAHKILPSLMQLLNLAQFSKPLCAVRGKMFMVPSIGVTLDNEDPVPYQMLREYTPNLIKLLLEADLDKRVVTDLQGAAQSLPIRTNIISPESWSTNKENSNRLHVIRVLVEASLVHVCHPGNFFESSLAQTFPKFSAALRHLASPTLWEEKPFFVSLVQAITRHKAKLTKFTRDTIVSNWLTWLQSPSKKKGSIFSAAHECFLMLLLEWVSYGNAILPRELVKKHTKEAVDAVNNSEKALERKFARVWLEDPELFVPIKGYYERILNTLPQGQANEWKADVGIENENENNDEL
jgi:Bromodomain